MSQPVNSIKFTPYDSVFLNKTSFSKGEVVFDKDNFTLRIMDGATAGGDKVITQSSIKANYVSKAQLKAILATATSFADFKAAILQL